MRHWGNGVLLWGRTLLAHFLVKFVVIKLLWLSGHCLLENLGKVGFSEHDDSGGLSVYQLIQLMEITVMVYGD